MGAAGSGGGGSARAADGPVKLRRSGPRRGDQLQYTSLSAWLGRLARLLYHVYSSVSQPISGFITAHLYRLLSKSLSASASGCLGLSRALSQPLSQSLGRSVPKGPSGHMASVSLSSFLTAVPTDGLVTPLVW